MIKTHKGLKKRIKVTGKKKLFSMSGGKSHLLKKKSTVRKKRLGKAVEISNTKLVKTAALLRI